MSDVVANENVSVRAWKLMKYCQDGDGVETRQEYGGQVFMAKKARVE